MRLKTKCLSLIVLCLLIFTLAFAPFMSIASAHASDLHQKYAVSFNQRCVYLVRTSLKQNLVPLSLPIDTKEWDCLTGFDSVFSPIAPLTYQRHEGYVHTGDGRRVAVEPSSGMLFTEDAALVTHDDRSNTARGSTTIQYNEFSDEFIDGANLRLGVYLNSRLDRFDLMQGGKYTRAIELTADIHKINYNCRATGVRLIFVRIIEEREGWWIFGSIRRQFFDMNGRLLNENAIAQLEQPPLWRSMWGITWSFWTGGTIYVHMFSIIESTTLADLREWIRHATYHPWPYIICLETGFRVVTEDGLEIRVNPRRQITCFFGHPLFDSVSGLPIIYYDYDILTIDGAQQSIEAGVLLNAMSTYGFLARGELFHIHITQPTQWGVFDMIVHNRGSVQNPDWRTPAGDNSREWTINHAEAESRDDWFGLGALWNSIFSFDGNPFMQALRVGLFVVVGLIALFVILKLGAFFIAIFKGFGKKS